MIEVTNLTVSKGRKKVIKNLEFSLPADSWTGVLGANGTGKTTLLESLSGRHLIDSGIIAIDGVNFAESRVELASRISIAPTIDSLPTILTVRQLIDLIATSVPKHTKELMQVLEIERVMEKRIGALSSGFKQRVSIYLAFLHETNIVVLDEPFNWLDPVNSHDLKLVLKRMVRSGTTLLTALHDTATFVQYCDAGTLLNGDGQAIEISSEMLDENRADTVAFEREIIRLLRSPE